jgi:hypothetical protein
MTTELPSPGAAPAVVTQLDTQLPGQAAHAI